MIDAHMVVPFLAERVGVEVVECACVIEIPELNVSTCYFLSPIFLIYIIASEIKNYSDADMFGSVAEYNEKKSFDRSHI